MSLSVRFAIEASDDLERLFDFLAEKDLQAAVRAIEAIKKAVALLATFPFNGVKSGSSPFIRQIIISFGSSGYVALYEIEDAFVTILAVRHQSEIDFY